MKKQQINLDSFQQAVDEKFEKKKTYTIEQIINEIEPNQKGQFEGDGGNVLWYLDSLIGVLKKLE